MECSVVELDRAPGSRKAGLIVPAGKTVRGQEADKALKACSSRPHRPYHPAQGLIPGGDEIRLIFAALCRSTHRLVIEDWDRVLISAGEIERRLKAEFSKI